MPPAVLVSARGLFSRCPECGTVSQGNRMNERIFLCISCGHVEQLETVGAVNLAGKLAQYRKEKLTVYYETVSYTHLKGKGRHVIIPPFEGLYSETRK